VKHTDFAIVPFRRVRPFLAFVIFLGVSFFALSAYFAWSTRAFLGRAVQAPGEVVALEQRYNDYFPVVTYLDHAGTPRELRTKQGTTKPLYFKGEKITVVYDPADPEFPAHARIKDFHELWAGPVDLVVLGFLWVIMPTVLWVASSKARQRADREMRSQESN
jgi:hypothetical protein